MSTRITASWETLLEQSTYTGSTYLDAAIKQLDEQFGEGYAKANPVLINGVMQMMSNDFVASTNMVRTQWEIDNDN